MRSSQRVSALRVAPVTEPSLTGIEPGEILGDRFRVGQVIGRGGNSVVYDGRHIQLGQRVAVKVLSTVLSKQRSAFERALVEAQATARLTSEHVVRVIDVGTTKTGHPYVVMEKLVGNDLAQEIAKGIPAPIHEAVKIALQACHGLAEAHAAGIVHRDIKPSNLFLAMRPDKTVVVKVLDFGIARVDSSVKGPSVSTAPRMAGSPGYASPEQLGTASGVDARADVWGLGIVLYELVTGRRPFEAANLTDALIAASTKPMPPMTSKYGPVPPAFERIVRKCLEKDRENRFPSVLELAEALNPFAPPSFARYSERVRAVGGRAHSVGTIRVDVPEGPMTMGATISDTASVDMSLATKEADVELGGVTDAPSLVVASVVPPHRAALRYITGASVVAAMLFVLLAGHRLPSSPAAPSGAAAAAMAPPASSSLGPLPPLAVPGAPAQAAPEPVAARVVSMEAVDPTPPPAIIATPVVTPTPVAAPAPVAPPLATPVSAARPAPVRAAPRAPAPKPASPPLPAKAPAGNPMTYR